MSRKKKTPLGTSRLARRLLAEMTAKKMSYSEYADDLGVPKTQLWDWLHDKHAPRVETLVWFAQHFDCDLVDLVDGQKAAS